jgi:hypothetical protein
LCGLPPIQKIAVVGTWGYLAWDKISAQIKIVGLIQIKFDTENKLRPFSFPFESGLMVILALLFFFLLYLTNVWADHMVLSNKHLIQFRKWILLNIAQFVDT